MELTDGEPLYRLGKQYFPFKLRCRNLYVNANFESGLVEGETQVYVSISIE